LSGIVPDIELDFTPPDDQEKKDVAKFVREEDLEGHMENEDIKDMPPVEKDDEMEEEHRVKMLLERDNQVRHAVELLKTWSIFSQIKTAPVE
jgi:hypothetical protein